MQICFLSFVFYLYKRLVAIFDFTLPAEALAKADVNQQAGRKFFKESL
jgi:hypothetical protein